MIRLSTASPIAFTSLMYVSSFSTFLRYRCVWSFSVGSMSLGQPPSMWSTPMFFEMTRSVFTSCSDCFGMHETSRFCDVFCRKSCVFDASSGGSTASTRGSVTVRWSTGRPNSRRFRM